MCLSAFPESAFGIMSAMNMKYINHDGGRSASGYKGSAGDCVARSIAIASGRQYDEIYRALAAGNGAERRTKHSRTKSGKRTARNGIRVRRKWFKDYMASIGFKWVPTMTIGSGCTVHLAHGELPMGSLVVSVSRHYTAVIDGVIHDTYDPQREAGRCVYGYWIKS